jgi:hypothetical protein
MTRMMGLQGQKEYDGERGFIKEEVKCDMSIISCHVPFDNIGALNINIWYTPKASFDTVLSSVSLCIILSVFAETTYLTQHTSQSEYSSCTTNSHFLSRAGFAWTSGIIAAVPRLRG